MWKAALAGAIALATGMNSLALAQSDSSSYDSYQQAAPSGDTPIVTEAHIARLKSALRLTAEQHAYWAPVESALRALSRQQRQEASAGFVQRMSERASAMAGTAIQIRRLTAAAGPLIQALDEEQKRNAMALVRHFGFERLMASF